MSARTVRRRGARLVLGLVLAIVPSTGLATAGAAEPSRATAETTDALTNHDAPHIEGDVRVAGRAELTIGAWSHPGVQLTYQWYLDGQPIPGATGRTYVPTVGSDGKILSATVTASLAPYEPVRVWAVERWVVGLASLVWSDGPRIVGTRRVGSTLRGVGGLVTPTPTAPRLQWTIEGVPVPGATGTTFVLLPQHARKHVGFVVQAEAPGYEPARRTSGLRDSKVASGVLRMTRQPAVRGTAAVGRRLQAVPGTFAPVRTRVGYQWLAGGKPIKGATRSSLRVSRKHRGLRISVRVTVSATGYATRTVTTRATRSVRR